MKMQLALHFLAVAMNAAIVVSCPIVGTNRDPPNDAIHQGIVGATTTTNLRHRRLAPLSKDDIDAIVNHRRRALGETECLTEATYDGIADDLQDVSDALPDNQARGHFFGGIVRLAAHDFMDFDISNVTDPMGMDGCIDFDHQANAGLPEDIWCEGCDLRTIFESNYASIMSRADFWVAAANAAILITSGGDLDLKDTFAFGRVDADICVDSATRLPQDTSCTFVEDVFLNRMNVSWTDAVALIGAHTLGRGSVNFSGHEGIWVDDVDRTAVFDKRFYEEMLRRAWIPRNLDDNGLPQDWTWGNNNNGNPRFMLNTDMCLLFDIDTERSPDNAVFPCCSRNDLLLGNGNNQCDRNVDGFNAPDGFENVVCNSYATGDTRTEASDAIRLFSGIREDGSFTNTGNAISNQDWFAAFRTAWEKATKNGWASLEPLVDSCTPTAVPTDAPSQSPSKAPSDVPSVSLNPTTPGPSSSPTESPSTSRFPTESPSVSPTEECIDPATISIEVNCQFIVDRNLCDDYAHICKDACGDCRCLARNRVCFADADCCSGICNGSLFDDTKTCDCLPNNGGPACTFDNECCSNNCDGGRCRRSN